MEYRNLGRSGLKVSELCLGTMQFGWTADEDTAYQVLNGSYQAGVNFIDTADIYSRWVEGNPGGIAETIVGRWIKKFSIAREKLVIATKVNGPMGDGPNDRGLSRVHIMNAVEASLRRLQTDWIDLYQAHAYDAHTPIEETLRAMDDLVRQGKVRYLGCSNYPAWRLMQALWVSDRLGLARFDCLQPHYNLLHRAEYEQELAEVCSTYGLGVIPYSPLAGGFLSGKYRPNQTDAGSQRHVERYFSERNWQTLNLLDELARARRASVSQISLAWMLTRTDITSPIIGPRSLEQLNDNLGAGGMRLNEEEMAIIESATGWRKK